MTIKIEKVTIPALGGLTLEGITIDLENAVGNILGQILEADVEGPAFGPEDEGEWEPVTDAKGIAEAIKAFSNATGVSEDKIVAPFPGMEVQGKYKADFNPIGGLPAASLGNIHPFPELGDKPAEGKKINPFDLLFGDAAKAKGEFNEEDIKGLLKSGLPASSFVVAPGGKPVPLNPLDAIKLMGVISQLEKGSKE